MTSKILIAYRWLWLSKICNANPIITCFAQYDLRTQSLHKAQKFSITLRHNDVSFSMHSETTLTKFSAMPLSCTGLQFANAKTAKIAIFDHMLLFLQVRCTLFAAAEQVMMFFPKMWWILSFGPPLHWQCDVKCVVWRRPASVRGK